MLRDIIPARYRQIVYSALTTLFALELIFDIIPEGAQSKILAALAVLGFSVAAGNTTPKA